MANVNLANLCENFAHLAVKGTIPPRSARDPQRTQRKIKSQLEIKKRYNDNGSQSPRMADVSLANLSETLRTLAVKKNNTDKGFQSSSYYFL